MGSLGGLASLIPSGLVPSSALDDVSSAAAEGGIPSSI